MELSFMQDRMTFTDQMNRTIQVSFPPKRIVSLVPSQTELLYDLGLEEEVVGITKFCIHPNEWYRNKTRVGGTKKYKMDKIEALQPHLIIGNKEEGHEERVKKLMDDYPVWMSDVYTLADALDMIKRVGALVERERNARQLAEHIRLSFNDLPSLSPLSVAYFIWREPYMVAGSSTFIDHVLTQLGLTNVYGDQPRYPSTTFAELAARQPDLIFLSSEPYPFGDKHFDEFQQACPDATIKLVDGEFFSWYGSRLQKAVPYFNELASSIEASSDHPEV